MGSAPVRRQFESRVASSVRRGAVVGLGTPGVYRINRSKAATSPRPPQARAVTQSDWVQPDDVATTAAISQLIRTEYGTTGSGASNSISSATAPVEAQSVALMGDTSCRWQTVVIRLSEENLSADPVSPTPPPGMTVEYESPAGLLLSATIEGKVIVTADAGVDPPLVLVQESLTADLVPGMPVPPYGFVTGPTHTTAGNPVWSHSGQGTWTFGPLTQTFPAEQAVGWRIGDENALDETNPAGDGTVYVTVQGTATAAVQVSYTYRPPRYRFV